MLSGGDGENGGMERLSGLIIHPKKYLGTTTLRHGLFTLSFTRAPTTPINRPSEHRDFLVYANCPYRLPGSRI